MSAIATLDLLNALRPVAISAQLPFEITGITQDSRRVKPGYIFAVRSGTKNTGIDYLRQAQANGASAIMIEGTLPDAVDFPFIQVPSFRPALVTASKVAFGDPSSKLDLFGVTGTNGKTSTVHLFRSIIESVGAKCAMLSTVGYWTGMETIEAPLTTPDIDLITELLSASEQNGSQYAVMEVSSHALDQGRVRGLRFQGGGFTNLSVDHLDYHRNMIEYSGAKERFFRTLPLSASAAININGSWGCRMLKACWSPAITVGSEESGADLRVGLREHTVAGGAYCLTWQEKMFDVKTTLVGVYQGENLALAAALALSHGIEMPEVLRGIGALKAVPGRMESVNSGQPFAVFVDYAHTPDALERALLSIRPLTQGRLLVMFGCGGDRDRTKRPQMGKIAAKLADRIFITSDNPRTEDPTAITSEIFGGVPENLRSKVTVNVDRLEATFAALRSAEVGDIVLLAGKGSEWYQEINGVRHPYDDRLVCAEALREIGYYPKGVER